MLEQASHIIEDVAQADDSSQSDYIADSTGDATSDWEYPPGIVEPF